MNPVDFLTLLWGDQPPGLICLWRKKGRRSTYIRAPEAANMVTGHTDVYTAVAITAKDRGATNRPKAAQAAALAGLWLDLDVNGGPDDKQGVAPTVEAAIRLARRKLEPTMLVNSGYGVHGWWLFEQPWVFETIEDRDRAALASAQWYELHRRHAKQDGWQVDHTHDLARLLRLPGTLNGKGGKQSAVTVIMHGGRRYTLTELLDVAATVGPIVPTTGGHEIADVALGGQLADDQLHALLDQNTLFAKTWRHRRTEHPDWSLSEYDLALCSIAAGAGWSDQDLADLIAAHRAEHGDDRGKAGRSDYVQRTIARARTKADRPDAEKRHGATLTPEQWRDHIVAMLEREDEGTIPTPFTELTEALDGGLRPGEVCLVAGYTSHGKALEATTPIPTRDGWKPIRHVQAGDEIAAPDGSWTRVVANSGTQDNRPCFRVTFSDGASVVADTQHLWTVMTNAARIAARRLTAGQQTTISRVERTITTSELRALVASEHRPVTIPAAAPIPWPEAKLPIGPYTLGAWLGDGDAHHAALTMHIDDAGHVAARILTEEDDTCDVQIAALPSRPHLARIRVTRRRDVCRRGHRDRIDVHGHCRACINTVGAGRDRTTWTQHSLRERLRHLGVLGAKRIPAAYLTASPSQRLALLQGLMDTDGTVHVQRAGRCVIGLSDRALADDTRRLVLSLGIKATISVKSTTHRDSFLVAFSTAMPVCTLPRKAALLPSADARMHHRRIASVEPVASRPVCCIQVDRPDGLYCAGHELIVTHNSILVDQIADSAANHGRRVHLYLTEMTAYQRGLRLLARRSGVPFRNLKRRDLNVKAWSAILPELDRLSYGCSIVSDWTVEDVVTHIRTNQWDLAVIDLVHGFHYHDERDLSKTSSALARAAKGSTVDHAGTAIIAAAHLNDGQMRDARSPKRPRPGLHSIKGSSSLKQDADVVIFVWQVDDEEGLPSGEGSVWIAKCRQGELAKLDVTLNPVRMQFERATGDWLKEAI